MHGTPRMKRRSDTSITTPKTPVNTSFIIPTNPSVILNKKTIRNYVPSDSNNMLRAFEDNRKSNKVSVESRDQKSSVDQLIDDFHRNLPSPTHNKVDPNLSLPFSDADSMFSATILHDSRMKSSEKPAHAGTVTSQTSSHWSVASSAASFDYHSVNSMENKVKKRLQEQHSSNLPSLEEVGERTPPEGADEEPATATVVVKKENIKNNVKEAVDDLMKASENDEDLSMLRKLISEGRISGMHDPPPPFTPPTPPSKQSQSSTSKISQSEASNGRDKVSTNQSRANSEANKTKKPAPRPEAAANKSGDRPRKTREAPKPPVQIQGSSSADIKFISGRRINSVESINDDQSSPGFKGRGHNNKNEGIKRSTSMHVPKGRHNIILMQINSLTNILSP